jgi:membrane complex biogenesis BtpA family protein
MPTLFSRSPVFIGVVHLRPLPGAPRFEGSFEAVVERAVEDAKVLCANGCDAVLVENFGDTPFFPAAVPPVTVACMTACIREVAAVAGALPVGVNVLRNDASAAIAIAAATGASFARVNVHTGAAVTDQGLLEGLAHETVRQRAHLARELSLLCDAHVKHATPLGNASLSDSVSDLVLRGGADAVIITGRATGVAPLAMPLEQARAAAAGRPVLIGSGLDSENAARLLPLADGAIVGTSLKHGARIDERVDAARVGELARVFETCRRGARGRGPQLDR